MDKRKKIQLSNAKEIERMKQYIMYVEEQTRMRFAAFLDYFQTTVGVDVFKIYNDKMIAAQEAAKLASEQQTAESTTTGEIT